MKHCKKALELIQNLKNTKIRNTIKGYFKNNISIEQIEWDLICPNPIELTQDEREIILDCIKNIKEENEKS